MDTDNPDIYSNWIASIRLSESRVVGFPSFIFLCGGKVAKDPSALHGPLSFRHAFLNYVRSNQIEFQSLLILAEDVFDAFEHTAYRDLLTFESDIAELSSLIVIFSESPGSIAELGSFAVIESIKHRLLIVLTHRHASEGQSFILRGPVQRVTSFAEEAGRSNPLAVFNWHTVNLPKPASTEPEASHDTVSTDCEVTTIAVVADADLKEVCRLISEVLNRGQDSAKFDDTQPGHKMLLLADILRIVQIAKLQDLIGCLSLLGITCSPTQLKQWLSVLQSLHLAQFRRYSNNSYWISRSPERRIKWHYLKEAEIRDDHRWMSEFVSAYERFDRQKANALRFDMENAPQP